MSSKPGKLGVPSTSGAISIVSTSKITRYRGQAPRGGREMWPADSAGVWRAAESPCGACMPRGVVGLAAEDGRTAAVETL